MMNDENIVIRALEPEDLEYLYQWETTWTYGKSATH